MQFSSLIDFVIEIAGNSSPTSEEQVYLDRMIQMQENEFWPGRGIQIEDDFPDLEEQKYWARIFLDTARAIYDRRVGDHGYSFWQSQRIWQLYGVGQLFIEAVRACDNRWAPHSIDHDEFDRVVNRKERP